MKTVTTGLLLSPCSVCLADPLVARPGFEPPREQIARRDRAGFGNGADSYGLSLYAMRRAWWWDRNPRRRTERRWISERGRLWPESPCQ